MLNAVVVSRGEPVYQRLKSFGNPDRMGTNPSSTPIQGSDGFLYGTTYLGGQNKAGTVYRVHPDGAGYQVIYHFATPPPFGSTGQPVYPIGRLVEASDGRLYGTALNAGSSFGGAIFRVEKSGAGFSRLRVFPTSGNQPTNPVAGLIQASDGMMYGATSEAGPSAPSTIYRIALDGTNYQVLHTLSAASGAALNCLSPLMEGSDGKLYGTSRSGGASNGGILFKLNKDGTGYEVVHSFVVDDESAFTPWGGVIESGDGRLYGTLEYGGTRGGGVVFRIGRDGSGYEHVWNFAGTGAEELRRPRGELVESSDGYLNGVAQEDSAGAPGGVFRVRRDGTGFEVLARLAPVALAKELPQTGLVLTTTGAMYGVAGDWYDQLYPGFLFRLASGTKAFDVVHQFTESGGEPYLPYSIFEASDGRFYGATNRSDFTNDFFSVSRDGREARVHYKYSGETRAESPVGTEFFEGQDKRFYAASYTGGVNAMGSVTRIDPSGLNHTLIHSFIPAAKGPHHPRGGVIQGSDGWLYGTTGEGGRYERGTIVRVAADGTAADAIHSFEPLPDNLLNHPVMQLLEGTGGWLHGVTEYGCFRLHKSGAAFKFTIFPRVGVTPPQPRGPLIEASDGVLYGTTSQGGSAGLGNIFKINQDGNGFAILHDCTAAAGAPYRPIGSLAEGTDGKLYGVTSAGGIHADQGALFSINRDGTGFTRLHSFGANGDGIRPVTLVRSGDGLLYGTTQYGGSYNFGTFFRYGEAPEIAIHDGLNQEAPELIDDQSVAVDFGRTVQGTPVIKPITIVNTGTAPLLVSGLSVPDGYEFAGLPAIPFMIAAGTATGLELKLIGTKVGANGGQVVITSNDSDEGAFEFPVIGEVHIPAPTAEMRDEEIKVNRQTGLLEQVVRIHNNTTATVPAYEIILRNLPTGIVVNNATGMTEDGGVILQVLQPLKPFSFADIVIEYRSSGRRPLDFEPAAVTRVLLAPPDDAAPEGEPFIAVDRILRQPDGSVLIEFTSIPGAEYRIEYSADSQSWHLSPSVIKAAGNRTQWIDRGPPRTASPPSENSTRFYRLKQSPNQ